MNFPRISVITPSFNQGQFLEETLLSVINQKYPNLEYIVIDGGSTDISADIIKKYEQHLAYWVSEKDSGQSEAINKGFKRATGDIVCWINSDDILMPGALNNVMKYYSDHRNVDFINGYSLVVDAKSNILYNYFILKQKKWYAKKGIYYISQPSMFWRRSVFEKIGYLKEDFHAMMDKEFLIRILKNNLKVGQIQKVLAAFRVHGTSKTSINGEIWSRDTSELINLYGKEYGQRPKLFYKLIYGFEKLLKGLYFKSILFRLKWNGRNFKELEDKNCIYL